MSIKQLNKSNKKPMSRIDSKKSLKSYREMDRSLSKNVSEIDGHED